jgi:hypothetical protein
MLFANTERDADAVAATAVVFVSAYPVAMMRQTLRAAAEYIRSCCLLRTCALKRSLSS